MPDLDPRSSADAEWENLLLQWRTQSQAQPRPYFYQRVHARLVAGEPARPWLPAWLRRPAYAAMLGLLGLALSGDCAALTSTSGAAPQPAEPVSPRPAAAR